MYYRFKRNRHCHHDQDTPQYMCGLTWNLYECWLFVPGLFRRSWAPLPRFRVFTWAGTILHARGGSVSSTSGVYFQIVRLVSNRAREPHSSNESNAERAISCDPHPTFYVSRGEESRC
ncbi:unnamed protein product [Ectocarpus sp. 4 AP-2014]